MPKVLVRDMDVLQCFILNSQGLLKLLLLLRKLSNLLQGNMYSHLSYGIPYVNVKFNLLPLFLLPLFFHKMIPFFIDLCWGILLRRNFGDGTFRTSLLR